MDKNRTDEIVVMCEGEGAPTGPTYTRRKNTVDTI